MPLSEAGLDYRVGQIDGRITTMESRMDRHEEDVRGRLASIDKKLDSLIESRAEQIGSVSWERWLIATVIAVIGLFIGGLHQFKDLFTSTH